MNIVIVESQTKADLINQFLGTDHQVIAVNGNIRELPTGLDSVGIGNQFKLGWQILPKSKRKLQELVKTFDRAERIIFASNSGREGEANAWHILETLHNWKTLGGKQIQRVSLSSLTKEIVHNAFTNPRKLAAPLIDAYRAQTAIDHIFHCKLNSLFLQQLPGTRVTSRDQTATLKLLCDLEVAIENFAPIEYWDFKICHSHNNGNIQNFILTEFDGKQFDSMNINYQRTG